LESTLAFVVTLDGVVLIGSGGSPEQAAWIEAAVVRTTDRPIIRVINIGAEAYHWLGNGYFAQKGIPIFALERTDRAQRRLAETRLGQRPGAGSDQAAGVEPVFASEVIYDDEETFIMGGINFSLNWPGGGRLLGDSVVWLPTQKILISGDYIYHDRLLEFDEETPVMRWRQSFSRLMGMKPKTIVAGHGRPGSAGKSERQTGDYLSWLTGSLRQALAERESLEDIVARMARKEDFSRLALFEALHRENIRRAYRLMKGD
jgi:glyoxylase-like metal-dependent hydrolase (beta-lactamase superfamily II)